MVKNLSFSAVIDGRGPQCNGCRDLVVETCLPAAQGRVSVSWSIVLVVMAVLVINS